MHLLLAAPATPADWAAYYALRYRVLRAPWQQPPGSERAPDDDAPTVVHRLARDPATGAVVGVGRLHFPAPHQAQVRFMAVAPEAQGRGIGAQLLAALEEAARAAGATTVVLDARESAVAFYHRRGYHLTAPGHLLFGRIPHWKMEKGLGFRV